MSGQSTIDRLIDSIESSLADIAEALGSTEEADRMKSIERVLGAIETGIAEIAEASQKKTDLAPLVEAIKSIKPTVTVHVPAAPAPIVQILPQENQKEGATWELRMPGAYGAPERVLTVKRVA